MLQKMQTMQQLYKSDKEYKEKTEDEIKMDLLQNSNRKYLKYKIKYLELKKYLNLSKHNI